MLSLPRPFSFLSCFFICLQLFISPSLLAETTDSPGEDPEQRQLKVAYFPFYPYQYSKDLSTTSVVTGLDIQLARSLSREVGVRLKFEQRSWSAQLKALEKGEQDIALGAIKNKEREEFLYYSDPIRFETTVLYVLKDELSQSQFSTVEEMLSFYQRNQSKIGVVEKYAYANEQINQFINNPSNNSTLFAVSNDVSNFNQLLSGRVKCILVDRVVGASLVNENNWGNKVVEHPIHLGSRDLHFVFSKKTISKEMVDQFNQALAKQRENGEYSEIIREYLFPVMLSVTANAQWYFIIFLIGIVSYTLYALRIAYQGNFGLIGTLIIATSLALGGGSMRDMIVGRYPIFIIKDPVYIYMVMITTIVVFGLLRVYGLVSRWVDHKSISKVQQVSHKATNLFFDHLFDVIDALGLAAFTVIGVIVAIEAKALPLLLWGPLLAVCTTAGGGILCDLLSGNPHNSSMRGSFYPEVAAIWGFLLSLFFQWQSDKANPEFIFLAVVVTITGAFITRLLALKFKISGLMFSLVKKK